MRINWPLLLLAVLVAIGIYALYDRIEFYKKTEAAPMSEAARRNPFLAAQRYLETRHIAVRSGAELVPRDDLRTRGTLILSQSTAVRSREVAEQLWQWVERGGHLIVAPGYRADNDLLLARLHIKRVWPEYEAKKTDDTSISKLKDDDSAERKLSEQMRAHNERIKRGEKHPAKTAASSTQCPAPDPTNLTDVALPGTPQPLQIGFSNYTALKQPYLQATAKPPASDVPKSIFHAANKSGVHIVQFAIQRGRVTVLSDMNIWEYTTIGERDHVLLLDALIDPTLPVQILYGVNAPKLIELVWRYAYETVVSGLLLLCAWLIYRGRRFGPVLDNTQSERRASSEHWLASARYQWQNGQADGLLNAVRAAIERKAALRFPNYAQWPVSEKLAALSMATAISTDELHHALHTSTQNAEVFCECIATLQLLGSRL